MAIGLFRKPAPAPPAAADQCRPKAVLATESAGGSEAESIRQILKLLEIKRDVPISVRGKHWGGSALLTSYESAPLETVSV